MKKNLILLLILIFIPSSADAFGKNKTMAAIMNSWIGESIHSVISTWGYPDCEKTIAGRKLYYWNWEYTVGNPTYTNARLNGSNINAYSYGGGGRNVYCNRVLEVDKNNVVTTWNWSGNNCPYTKVRLYKDWVNPKVLKKAEEN